MRPKVEAGFFESGRPVLKDWWRGFAPAERRERVLVVHIELRV